MMTSCKREKTIQKIALKDKQRQEWRWGRALRFAVSGTEEERAVSGVFFVFFSESRSIFLRLSLSRSFHLAPVPPTALSPSLPLSLSLPTPLLHNHHGRALCPLRRLGPRSGPRQRQARLWRGMREGWFPVTKHRWRLFFFPVLTSPLSHSHPQIRPTDSTEASTSLSKRRRHSQVRESGCFCWSAREENGRASPNHPPHRFKTLDEREGKKKNPRADPRLATTEWALYLDESVADPFNIAFQSLECEDSPEKEPLFRGVESNNSFAAAASLSRLDEHEHDEDLKKKLNLFSSLPLVLSLILSL